MNLRRLLVGCFLAGSVASLASPASATTLFSIWGTYGHARLIRRVGAFVAGAAMVVVGATVTTIARAGSNDESTSAPVLAQLHPSRVLPRNAHGLSYGSSEPATSDAEVPNLVLVYATNGKLGYVNSSDLIGKSPGNPQQAIASNSANSRATAIPVYAVDGVTKIGEFVKQPATPR